MDTGFCLDALEEAMAKFGKPEILNTDQGSQFTSLGFTRVPQESGIHIGVAAKTPGETMSSSIVFGER